MSEELTQDSWRQIRRHRRRYNAILRHQLRRRRTTVLVAECHDGLWATSNLHLGSTTGVLKLTLGMAGSIKQLYEVDDSPTSLTFSSVFETENEGAIVDGDISVVWHVTDPVALIKQPKFDHLNAIRTAVEDVLRSIVYKTALEDIEILAERVDSELKMMRQLREGPIAWGAADTLFRLTGIGALHRHSLESIRRARIVDREQRSMDRERISFYADVIDSGKISLLAMMLSNDKTKIDEVLRYIQMHDIPIGRSILDKNDPFRNAVGRIMSEADEFDLHEMRLAWLENVTTRSSQSALSQLQESLNETLEGTRNGTKRT
ncbi:hypothetical protein [Amycolatopsis sp. H20-H5]|uniref:hypothetical protein n=1 Tax=Amycolatopsis sp. H20-H5 TaxID=3046309 RepID=UPI002DB9EBEF|nr:hypothetical protein [Amycolatopsis sp. H20-H5]MEC3977968.1 hypothetical protein [Amycolatopsis sp. H20-H5]